MTTLCELGKNLPHLIGAILDRETKLKKGRFREETLTDVFTAALAAFAGPHMVIEYLDEAATGGDLDLDFWHVSTGSQLSLRIQAKRLNAEGHNKKAVLINHRSYNELLHVVPSTGAYQFETLLKASGSSLPLYMFYNHGSVVRDRYFRAAAPAVSGINLAFASDIAGELTSKILAKPKRLHHKRLSHLRPHFFDLATVLCPTGNGDSDVPSPEAVQTSLRNEWFGSSRDREQDDAVANFRRHLMDPEALSSFPDGRRRPADGPAIRFSHEVERPTITFISGRTGDSRTPKIWM